MPKRLSFLYLALGAALAFDAAAGGARADLIGSVAATVTPQAGGTYLYTYVVSDAAASTAPISEFDVSLTTLPVGGIFTPAGAAITSITMPTGFLSLYTTGDPAIAFASTDPTTDITPGTSGTFSFLSTVAPVSVGYQLSSFEVPGVAATGTMLAPATVPEPSVVVLSALGVLGFVGYRAFARRIPRAC